MPTSPYMSFLEPTVSVTLGPLWASEVNACLETIDAHDHSSGKGVKVTPSGLSISSDLAYLGNRASGLKSVQYANQGATLTGALDLGATYVYGGDLYYTNTSGTAVKVTSGGTLNSGALVSNLYERVAVNTNLTINPAATYVMLVVDTTAGRTITMPAANAVGAGRFYILKDNSGSSETNHITLAAGAGDNLDGSASLTLATNYGSWEFVSDGIHRWDSVCAVKDVQGVSVTAAAPAAGNVIRATSATTSAWGVLDLASTNAVGATILASANMFQATTATSGAVKLAGDFDSTSTAALPRVSALTGDAADVKVAVNADSVMFAAAKTATLISQTALSGAAAGGLFRIRAQDGLTNNNGGIMDIASGAKSGTGLGGLLELRVGGAAGPILLGGAEVATGRYVASLACNTTMPDATAVPSGNRVVFISNLGTLPVIAPVGGCLVGSNAGNFVVVGANSGGNAFEIIGTSAGAAATFPSTPNTFLQVKYNGTTLLVPLYNP